MNMEYSSMNVECSSMNADVARWNGLEILIPKHMRKSKIRPLELKKDKKPRKYLFLETPCRTERPCLPPFSGHHNQFGGPKQQVPLENGLVMMHER